MVVRWIQQGGLSPLPAGLREENEEGKGVGKGPKISSRALSKMAEG